MPGALCAREQITPRVLAALSAPGACSGLYRRDNRSLCRDDSGRIAKENHFGGCGIFGDRDRLLMHQLLVPGKRGRAAVPRGMGILFDVDLLWHRIVLFRAEVSVKNKLRELRAAKNWSQSDLGEKLGVSRQTINAIETEKYDPSLPLAFKVARLFKTPIEAIFQSDDV